MLAILVPSRQRPEQLKRMIESVRVTTTQKITIYLCISVDDDPAYWPILTGDIIVMHRPDNYPTAQKWNDLALHAISDGAELLMLGSDDMYFTTPLWDEAIIEHYQALGKKPHVYALQDSRDKDGTPHPIMTKEWVSTMGHFVPPIFLHWFVDSWTVANAKDNSCFTHLRDYELVHDKPSDNGYSDTTHSRIRQWKWHERDRYIDKVCQRYLELDKELMRKELSK